MWASAQLGTPCVGIVWRSLADDPQFVRSRHVSGISHDRSRKVSTPQKKRILNESPSELLDPLVAGHR